MSKRVLIAGASIAGPALAHWLHRYGFEVTVVERAPVLRPGGQAVDLRGVAKEVARRMGLDQQIRAACTDTRGMSVVNRKNKRLAGVRADQFEGDGMIAEIEILRGDLSAVLYGATKGDVEYVFGDRITELDDTGNGVEARFASGVRRDFDVVVGADGLHSSLRAMVFGPEAEFVHTSATSSVSSPCPTGSTWTAGRSATASRAGWPACAVSGTTRRRWPS
jgi:2-polyprenyl-6-methoxyphenol hydroxylase-like FAD-dependent oxidoreductase